MGLSLVPRPGWRGPGNFEQTLRDCDYEILTNQSYCKNFSDNLPIILLPKKLILIGQ